jgi:hypothetical protein
MADGGRAPPLPVVAFTSKGSASALELNLKPSSTVRDIE